MTREEKINAKVNNIHRHQGEIKRLEGKILKLFKFKGFEEEGMELPFVQEHEDGSILLVDIDGNELELDDACVLMTEFGCISPEDFY